ATMSSTADDRRRMMSAASSAPMCATSADMTLQSHTHRCGPTLVRRSVLQPSACILGFTGEPDVLATDELSRYRAEPFCFCKDVLDVCGHRMALQRQYAPQIHCKRRTHESHERR